MATGFQPQASWFIRVLLFKVIYPIIAFFTSKTITSQQDKSATQLVNAASGSESAPRAPFASGYYLDDEPFTPCAESQVVGKRQLVWKESVKLARVKREETVLSDWT
ncbi:hypothetical protein F4808DRAFT_456631 [Astrocystis sublimbata]|nr:hypothetical protein F4808DRAFT_456631 [Astrocystis sublimbata]